MLHLRSFRLFRGNLLSVTLLLLAASAAAQQLRYSSKHLQNERPLPQTVTGGSQALQAKLNAGRTAISVAVADFDGDGIKDLLTGYATQAGGALLLQRGSAAALGSIQHGQTLNPYFAQAQPIDLPIRPDLLQAADISGHGLSDIVVGAKGAAAIYLLRGKGMGSFAAPRAIALSGSLSALTTWTSPAGERLIVAAVCSSTGCGLQLVGDDGKTRAFLPTSNAVTAVQTAVLHGHGAQDLVAVAAGKVLVAQADLILGKSPAWTTLPVSGALATAAGSFVYDRRGYQQLSVLDGSGTLHVFARPGVDSSVPARAEIKADRRKHGSAASIPAIDALGWAEIETLPGVAAAGSTPLLQRARVSGSGGDDLLALSGRQFVTVRHIQHSDGLSVTTAPVVVVDTTRSAALGVVAARLTPDSRQGTVIAEGELSPEIAPLPSVTNWYVNAQADTLDDLTTAGRCTTGNALPCSLRDAVGLANLDASANFVSGDADTINIPAGQYILTYNTGLDLYGDASYHMEVEGPVNFIGAGSGAVTIDGGNSDKIFSIDDPYDPNQSFSQAAFDTYFSGLTLLSGSNPNNPATASNPDGGLLDWDADGAGDLTFSSMNLLTSSTPWGHGGAVAAFSATDAGSGVLEFDNSAITANQTAEEGGGVFSSTGVNLVLNATAVASNSALITNFSGNDPNAIGAGGGIEFYGQGSVESSITAGSSIASNSATIEGGGLETQDTITINNSSFTTNSVVGDPSYGGGLALDGSSLTVTTTLAEDTFTGNSAVTTGGAIQEGLSEGDAGQSLIMHFSRIHGNSANTDSGLALGISGGTSSPESASVTDTWWGCDGPASGTGCDTADIQQSTSTTLTLTPYTTLILTLSSTTPNLNETFTATGSLGQDSAGTTYQTIQGQDAAYANLPASLTITQGGSVTTASATALDASASIAVSATATASGSATVTVDGFSVTQPFTVNVPTQLVFTTGPASPITAGGNAGLVQVSLEDGSGDVITTSSPTTVALTVTGPGSYSQTYSTPTASGVATFDLSTVQLTLPGTYTYTATSTGLTQAQVNEVVNPGAAASFSVTGYPSPAQIGQGATVTVTALDSYGNVATGFAGTVTLTSTDPHASLSGPYTYQPGDNGVSTFNVTLNTAGSQSITATSGAITGSQTQILVGDSIWLVNADGTLVSLNELGVPFLNLGSSNGVSTLGGVAFDASGNVWSVANATNQVIEYTAQGNPAGAIPYTAGISAPTAVAIDGMGYAWVANGDNSISELNYLGGQVSPSGNYQAPGVSAPTGIVIDGSGSVWITNSGNSSVTKIIGAAQPVLTPAVQQVVAGEQGVEP